MDNKFKYFLQIILAIVISSPLSLFILLLSDYLIDPQGDKDNPENNIIFYIIFTIYAVIIYGKIGIPTTLLADYLLKKNNLISFLKSKYLLQFLIYTLASYLLHSLPYGFQFYLPGFMAVFIPAQIYLHILLLLRIKRKKNTKEVELSS
ncbi:hypothetical protein HP456_11205 [Bacillus haikouensis]|jgi:hypothetical protein|uniref:hypothetical protein n=1 Tax=Bacillus haikouensis TaxID=1510468 RepID=UPI0015557CD2|nr:hypothetical protein [Bacillus haikouensis]NQD66484.1 hypothetical protein [Bacillus haikouensis]